MSEAEKLTSTLFGDLLTALSDTPYARLKTKLGREPTAAEFSAQLDKECVPPEYADAFQPVSIQGSMFGGGLNRVPICLQCGAMVYPTAIDRHFKFHAETMK
jgi:hypothetical protein